jgi:DNA-binding CsgD family transcriptional regulator
VLHPSGREDAIAAHLPMGEGEMTAKLTPKEKECLYWAGRRLSDAEIAQRLELSTRTVGNHLGRAYTKLGVHEQSAP